MKAQTPAELLQEDGKAFGRAENELGDVVD